MLTIDAQVHAYERNHAGRPWVGSLVGPAEVTGDQMVAAMDAVGVDGAVLVSPFSMYRYDASYATEVYAGHPNRFGLAIATVGGRLFTVGDVEVPFTIQSVSKAFVYCLALELAGRVRGKSLAIFVTD